MAGIYIHIPFCRKACHYCNFHFSTSLGLQAEMYEAISREINMQTSYLEGQIIETIYFGGGTPSLLPASALQQMMDAIRTNYRVSDHAEVTLEANPEDIDIERLRAWKSSGIDRLSIGIQALQDDLLTSWNRAHNATQGLESLQLTREAGFDNISADLIYGAPSLSDDELVHNLHVLVAHEITHLSCYALTVETGTALHHQISTGKAKPVDDEKAFRHFEIIQQQSESLGFMQYEVSNFCKPGHLSQHNTSYWKGIPYLGIGPAAHSFNGTTRQWNMSNNPAYIKAIRENKIPFEIESITPDKRYNEMVMTGLRTMWGIDTGEIAALGDTFKTYLERNIQPYLDSGKIMLDEGHYILHPKQYFFADGIASDLFFV
jgi:oxygen-independent coproporphyrinogen-3 oxidase